MAKKKNRVLSRKSDAVRLVESRHIGHEITDWSDSSKFEDLMLESFSHYNYFYDIHDARNWTIEWLKKYYPDKTKKYSSLEHWRTNMTVGSLCKMSLNGADLPLKRIKWMLNKIDAMEGVSSVDEVIVKKSSKSTYDNKLSDFIGEIECAIDQIYDEDQPYDLYSELQKMDATTTFAREIINYYLPLQDEWNLIVKNTDDQLKEAYRTMPMKTRKRVKKFVDGILTDLFLFLKSKKAARKPRKLKVKSSVVQTSSVIYQKSSSEFKIDSIDPALIVGASVVILFNTKLRKLAILHSVSKFAVKGSTIYNLDEKSSLRKTIRKPLLTLPVILNDTKIQATKQFAMLLSKPSAATGRINKDTIILKVFK